MRATNLLLIAALGWLSGGLAGGADSGANLAATTAPASPSPGPSPNSSETSDSAPTNLPPRLVVELRNDSGPHVLPSRRAYLRVGQRRFTFLVPDGFRMELAQDNHVSLVSGDLSCLLSFSVSDASSYEMTSQTCRNLVLQRHPDAKIAAEFNLAAANHSGPAFDLQWTAGGLERYQRVAFIPCQGTTLEFSLTSSPEKVGTGQASLNFMMMTARASDASGKLEIVPLSDKL